MKQGQIDRFAVTPVTFPADFGGGEGYQIHIVMDFADADKEPELLEVNAAWLRGAGCDHIAELLHNIAREVKKLPRAAASNNPKLTVVK